MTVGDVFDAVYDELGDAGDLVRDEQVLRWFNRGRARLGLLKPSAVELTWAAGAATVPLPADCVRADRIVSAPGSSLPGHVLLDAALAFQDPSCVAEGSATLYYGATYPEVEGDGASEMPPLADEAAISFALARFFRRVASVRADFRSYATLTGQSGIDVADLLDLAAKHDADYEEAKGDLVVEPPATFYGD